MQLSSEPTGYPDRPMAMHRVVRAALAEIDDDLVHVLVQPAFIAGGALVREAVASAVQLLAELIRDVVAAASPVAKVQVTGQVILDRYVLEVQDCGVGPSSDTAAEPAGRRLMDEAARDRLLRLIDHVGKAHGIGVHLCRSGHGGVNALVLLPRPLLTVEPTAVEQRERSPEPRGRPKLRSVPTGDGPRPAPSFPAAFRAAREGSARPDGSLPHRVPMASMPAELRGAAPIVRPFAPVRGRAPAGARPRSPQEVRSTLSSYHGGLQRGRLAAGTASGAVDRTATGA